MNDPGTLIFNIEKFAVRDGPGIRTVVFMKGCPLRCLWCHNPESGSFRKEILFSRKKCLLCGRCAGVCPGKCHILRDGEHVFDRSGCILCGKCAEVCIPSALTVAGEYMTVSQVMEQVLRDRAFYENSGGGITLSGGEPLAHFEFTKALLEASRRENLHTAVETSGYAPEEHVRDLLPLVDLWLWDVKASPELHKRLTGVEIPRIVGNLRMLDAAGARTILRCPIVPGWNDGERELIYIAGLADSLSGCVEINLEPYHPLGDGKAAQLGRKEFFHAEFADGTHIRKCADFIRSLTGVRVR